MGMTTRHSKVVIDQQEQRVTLARQGSPPPAPLHPTDADNPADHTGLVRDTASASRDAILSAGRGTPPRVTH